MRSFSTYLSLHGEWNLAIARNAMHIVHTQRLDYNIVIENFYF